MVDPGKSKKKYVVKLVVPLSEALFRDVKMLIPDEV